MLIATINTATELHREFINYDRDYYTNEAYKAMIEYFEDFENVELDVIGLCCEFNEDTIEEIISNYNINIEYEDNKLDEVMDYLNYNTAYAVETVDNKILYISF